MGVFRFTGEKLIGKGLRVHSRCHLVYRYTRKGRAALEYFVRYNFPCIGFRISQESSKLWRPGSIVVNICSPNGGLNSTFRLSQFLNSLRLFPLIGAGHMSTNDDTQLGVSNCYVFKSRLQEFAQKAGYTTPVYNTIKEGPSHQPYFRSTVIVNDVRYDSLIGFLNRKAAEQSAAEVALVELAKTGATQVYQPVHETGLCKNLLQEYAQKMNFAIPLYDTQKDDKKGRDSLFTCAIDIGGIKYIGGAAKTKKLAELKAARTALLAIESNGESTQMSVGDSIYTVIPAKRKATSSDISSTERIQPANSKKKKTRYDRKRGKGRAKKTDKADLSNNEEAGTELTQSCASFDRETDEKLDGQLEDLSAPKDVLVPSDKTDSKDEHIDSPSMGISDPGTMTEVIGSFVSGSDINTWLNEVNKVSQEALNELKQMEFGISADI